MRPKVYQKAGQLSLPHVQECLKQKENELKHENRWANKSGERSRAMRSVRQKQTKVDDKIFWKGRFWAQSETVKKW